MTMPHEALPNSKKRYVFRMLDRFWFAERRQPGRRDLAQLYGPTDSSLLTVETYFYAWRNAMKARGLLDA